MAALLTVLLQSSAVLAVSSEDSGQTSKPYRQWIEQMKSAPRGPFQHIRWFCNDGTILPPNASACDGHGGGAQHGEWNEQVKTLRADGYRVANILSNIDLAGLLADPQYPEILAQIALEQFLIAIDDGWILRQARFYRGALQEEGERRGARRLLFKLAEDTQWLQRRYLQLRLSARFIAHGPETDQVTRIRQVSSDLARRDPGFQVLRNKIHVRPDVSDADAVDDYARNQADAALISEYESLAASIRTVYQPTALSDHLQRVAQSLTGSGDLAERLLQAQQGFTDTRDARERFVLSADLLRLLRDQVITPNQPDRRIALVDTSLKLEAEHFAAGAQLRERLESLSRREIADLLLHSTAAIYGAGLISERQRASLTSELQVLQQQTISLAQYRAALDLLARVPNWATASLEFYYGAAVRRFSEIEPLSLLFIQDQLRGSALFFFAQALDLLQRDADRLGGVRSELYGEPVSGLRALNPGLASGPLRFALDTADLGELDREGIYVLRETVAELPPVAGIITAGEGNPLSHVQLLARNLGIPNVAVAEQQIDALRRHADKHIMLAVSPGGSVVIGPATGPAGPAGPSVNKADIRIVPDLKKLDLKEQSFIRLRDLGSGDSGRTVGPKAAKLGELKRHYPDAVTDGLAIPFGAFSALLDQPFEAGGESVFDWMVRQYRRLDALPEGSPQRQAETEQFRRTLEQWILQARPAGDFRQRLRSAMQDAFGPDGSYGVFVRSDTNVEDLPGFTGAGLNLTVPNLVGFDAVMAAIQRVWASPFSARAFAWRQALMDQPEHVYPAVLLLLTVPVEKSGVLVTRDVDNGDERWLSIAVNEGVGGAVDGQPAESLRVELASGKIRLLAQASTPWKRTVPASGGIVQVPVSGSNTVLQPAEIDRLVELVRTLPQRFPALTDDEGKAAPADIEFGFLDGHLWLFQIRPFLDSKRARNSAYLAELDRGREAASAVQVNLNLKPKP